MEGSGELPARARAVIIGAGIVGNSVAYHLSRLGWSELVLLDKGPLPNPGGSTGHASNFIFPTDHSRQTAQLMRDSIRQYTELGVITMCGGVEVARTEERMEELRRRLMSAKSWGVEPAALVTPEEIKEIIPYVDESVLLGGFYCPGVSIVNSVNAGTIMRERAVQSGNLTIADNTEVSDIETEGGRVRGVVTDAGAIECRYVVICCGVWSPKIARMAGASIPLTPAVHQMVDVGPVPRFEGTEAEIENAILRDMDAGMYERQKFDGMELGSYAHRAILHDIEEIPSVKDAELSPTEFPLTQEDFDPQLCDAAEVIPEIVAGTPTRYAINGLLSLTPDGMPLLGETAEVAGLWSAAAVWIREGPGVGRAIAEWMVYGEPEIDLQAGDIARFYDHQKTTAHIKARTGEGFLKTYGIIHPNEQWKSDRNVRLSPFYERARELGAVFFEAAGWERPQWYESNAPLVQKYGIEGREAEWDSRWWSPIIDAEHLAMRESAAMFDLTAFAIFDIVGPAALACVQKSIMRQANVALGKVIYTPVLKPNGGFQSDLTVMRLGEQQFRVVTGGAHGMSDLKWFADRLPEDGSAQIFDLTSSWCTLGLWGPRARDIMRSLTSDDVSHEDFAFGTCRTIEVGSLRVLASRISYVGDLGWELYVPIEQGAKLWDLVAEAGKPHGIIPAGIGVYAVTGRLEKCYRAFGFELSGEYDVVEAGMAWGKVKDQDFVGKEAHLRQREAAPVTNMCTLVVDDHTAADGRKRYMLGGEPVVTPAGEPITDAKGRRSYVTSAGAAPSLGRYVLMTYLPPEFAKVGEKLAVEYMNQRFPVTVASADSTAVFDPANERIRASDTVVAV